MTYKIIVIPSKTAIPNIPYLEKEIKNDDTWIYLNDEDNRLYTFSNPDGEGIILGDCADDKPLADLIDYIEDELESQIIGE